MAIVISRKFDFDIVIPTDEILAKTYLESDPFNRLYVALELIFLRSTMKSNIRDNAQAFLITAVSGLQQQYNASPEQEGAFVFSRIFTVGAYSGVCSGVVEETAQVITEIVRRLIVPTPLITRLEHHSLGFTAYSRAYIVPPKKTQEEKECVHLYFEMVKIPNSPEQFPPERS